MPLGFFFVCALPHTNNISGKGAMGNKIEALILRRVAEISQQRVAEALGRDPSSTSRIMSGQAGIHIAELDKLFETLGLEVFESDGGSVVLPREKYDALVVLAREALCK